MAMPAGFANKPRFDSSTALRHSELATLYDLTLQSFSTFRLRSGCSGPFVVLNRGVKRRYNKTPFSVIDNDLVFATTEWVIR